MHLRLTSHPKHPTVRFPAAEDHHAFTFNAAVPLKAEIEKGFGVRRGDPERAAHRRVDQAGQAGDGDAYRGGALGRGPRGQARRPKPDIRTTEAFKRAMLDANSICYVEQGATGIYLKGLFERMGIADQLKGKTKLLPPSNPAAHAVANGEAEIGMTQISEILPYPGAQLVGPLPAEIQLHSVYPADVGTESKSQDAGNAFIKFLTTPEAAAVLKAKGLEPSSS